jgi:hypothetical protein
MEANIAQQKHMAPELFSVFWPQGSRNPLEVMKKKHLYSKATDAYSYGNLTRQIWKEEWNKDLLPNAMHFIGFELKLKSLQDKDPKTRLSISNFLTQLIIHLFNLKMPNCCFRNEIEFFCLFHSKVVYNSIVDFAKECCNRHVK